MARIINKSTSSIIDVQRVDVDALGAVILVDDIRPLVDRSTGEHLRSQYTKALAWVATLQVPGMRSRDMDGGYAEINLRLEGDRVPMLAGPSFVELVGPATVSATNSRSDGDRRGSLTVRSESIRATDRVPSGATRSGLPVVLPEVIRWMGAAPAKGFGGRLRTEGDRPVFIGQLLADETGVRADTGEAFTARRPLQVEFVGEPGQALRPLQVVKLVGVGVQVQTDDFGRSARLILTADQVVPAPAAPPVKVSRTERSDKAETIETAAVA